MKKRMKTVLSIFLAVLMAVSCVPLSASSAVFRTATDAVRTDTDAVRTDTDAVRTDTDADYAYDTIVAGQTKSVYVDSYETTILEFKPTMSGTYSFYSTGSDDTLSDLL